MPSNPEIVIRIAADDKASAVLGKIGGKLQGLVPGFRKVGLVSAAAGAAIVSGLTLSAKSFAGAGEELANMVLRTGIAAEKLQGLKYAAAMANVGMGVLEIGIKTMQRNLVDAGDMVVKNMVKAQSTFGDAMKGQEDAFTRLGLSVEKLRGMSPEQQFIAVAEALAKIADPAQRAALAMDVFGISGTQMLPLLETLQTQGIDAFVEKLKIMGWYIDEAGIQKAKGLGAAFKTLEIAMGAIQTKIGELLSPTLTDLLTEMTATLGKVTAWAEKNPELAESLVLVAVKAGAALTVIGGIGLALPAVITGIKALAAVIGAIVLAFTGWGLIATAVFAAVIAGLVLLYIHWEKVMNFIKGSLNTVIGLLNKLPGINLGKLTSVGGVAGISTTPMTGTSAYVPDFQWGGTVPGMRGQPVPIMAHGGERVLSGTGGGGGSNVVVNVGGSVIAEHDLLNIIRQQLILVQNRNYTTGIT